MRLHVGVLTAAKLSITDSFICWEPIAEVAGGAADETANCELLVMSDNEATRYFGKDYNCYLPSCVLSSPHFIAIYQFGESYVDKSCSPCWLLSQGASAFRLQTLQRKEDDINNFDAIHIVAIIWIVIIWIVIMLIMIQLKRSQ